MSMSIATINPATGETLATFDPMTDDEVDERIAAAHEAFATYRTTTYAERAHWLGAAADLLDDARDDVARMMTTEMGKTLSAARAEAAQCAVGCRFYPAIGRASCRGRVCQYVWISVVHVSLQKQHNHTQPN